MAFFKKEKTELSLELLDHNPKEIHEFSDAQFGLWFKIDNRSVKPITIDEIGFIVDPDEKMMKISSPHMSHSNERFPVEIKAGETLTAHFQPDFHKNAQIRMAYAKSSDGSLHYYKGQTINRLNDC